ncbi:MAG TPA: alpha/beta fold hydrolase, partial [Coleofasciculaceae cyanobacterium]
MARNRSVRQYLGLGLGLIFLALGLLLARVYNLNQVHSESIRVARDADRTLMGRLYYPSQTTAPYPTMMLWHGVSSTKETMELLAIELARQGVAVLAFDAGGFGESYNRAYSEDENLADARTIAAYAYAHPEQFDATRIGVGGHSMGGATALLLANEDNRIKTAIVLGMSADINRFLPPNLLMGIGLYEQFHLPHTMRLMLQQGVGQPAKEFQLYGGFTKGSARKLVISPTSDHLMEPFNPTLIHESVEWAKQVFQIQKPDQWPIASGFFISQFLVLLGSTMSVGYALKANRTAQAYPRLITIGFFGVSLLILMGGIGGQLPERLTTDLILLIAILLPIGHYAIDHPDRLTVLFRMTGLYLILIVLTYAIVAVGLRSEELIANPALILNLPQFILQMPIAMIYSRMHELRSAMFPVYSHGIVPSWTLILLFLPELVKPGIVLNLLTQSAVSIVRWLRQPWQINHLNQSSSGRSLQLLSGLSVLLTVLLYQQAQSGVLSFESAWSAMNILLRMGLLPAVLIIGILRSTIWQNIERRCLKS